jgi:hypothetical protein
MPSRVYQGVFWEIINRQIGHLGIKIRGVKMKILGILHDFRIFFIGKGSFYRTLGKARKIHGLQVEKKIGCISIPSKSVQVF